MSNELREELAALSHDIWASWMSYLIEKCDYQRIGPEENNQAAIVIPMWAVTRWTRQIHTPYAELSEAEKNSDREQADKILAVLDVKHET